MKFMVVLLGGLALSVLGLVAAPAAEVVEVRKIWDAAPHNAFTDLTWFNRRWFCVFREGKEHVSPDGALRVITSTNGTSWTSAAIARHPLADLRDPKITITPGGELMPCAAGAMRQPNPIKHQTLAWLSPNGRDWSHAVEVGETNVWLWRIAWNSNRSAYGIGYDTNGENFTRLYSSTNGRSFKVLLKTLFNEGQPNESGLVFLPDDRLACILRRDGKEAHAMLGVAQPPYLDWNWRDLGAKIGGPQLIQLPDGRLIGAGRLYDGAVRTSVFSVDLATGQMSELVKLPSGGDCGYPGLVWHENLLWVSYYSSHEGKTSIYLAKVKLD